MSLQRYQDSSILVEIRILGGFLELCVSTCGCGATMMFRMLGEEASLCPIGCYCVCVVNGGGSAIIYLEDLNTWPMVHSSTR